MKKLLLISLVSFSALAQVEPLIKNGEVKINYPCEILDSIPKGKEDKETISFFERGNNTVYASGYILRKRATDFTVKYRADVGPIVLDETIYQNLLNSPNGEMKCELDLTYDPNHYRTSRSCSFKSDTTGPIDEHFMFFKESFDLTQMREIKVSTSSWKMKLSSEQERKSPFIKKPSVERWTLRGECRLEVSGKFESQEGDPREMDDLTTAGLNFLKGLIDAEPSELQGNKTAWVLGIKH